MTPVTRILVVEDSQDIADLIAHFLQGAGYVTTMATNGSDGLKLARATPPDAIILDLMLPDGRGIPFLRRLRAKGDVTPVIILTALDQISDRIEGLNAGADDYLVKPFELPELKARVRALLRRDAGRGGSVLEVGRLVLDDVRHEATRDGQVLDLTAKELSLLHYFMAHVDEVLSQEHLLEHVWDEHTDPFTNTVRVTVGTLRRKLAAAGGDEGPLETVVGRGYRLEVAG